MVFSVKICLFYQQCWKATKNVVVFISVAWAREIFLQPPAHLRGWWWWWMKVEDCLSLTLVKKLVYVMEGQCLNPYNNMEAAAASGRAAAGSLLVAVLVPVEARLQLHCSTPALARCPSSVQFTLTTTLGYCDIVIWRPMTAILSVLNVKCYLSRHIHDEWIHISHFKLIIPQQMCFQCRLFASVL